MKKNDNKHTNHIALGLAIGLCFGCAFTAIKW